MPRSVLIYTIVLSTLLFPRQFANACGFSMYHFGEDYRTAFLNPYLLGDDYSAFFYSSERLNHYQNDHNGNDRNRNCEEWATRLGGDISTMEIKEFLYRTTLDDVLNAVAEGPENERFGANQFFQSLLQPSNKAVLDYLVFAKKYEHYSNGQAADPWRSRWKLQERNESELAVLQKMAEAAMHKHYKDYWLRNRYAYQLLLMHRYAGRKEAFHELYFRLFKNRKLSVLNEWASHHRAAMVDDPAESAYLYAMSFNRCPEKNVASYQNFNKSIVKEAMSFTRGDAERAAVLALCELKNPGRSLNNIRSIFFFDHTTRHLPLLLVREVNKLEDWLFTKPLTNGEPTVYVNNPVQPDWQWDKSQWAEYRRINRENDLRYLSEFRQFLQEQIGREGMDNDLLNLLVGHLLSMEQNPDAGQYLQAVSDQCPPAMQHQKTTEELLWLLNQKDLLQPATQDKIAALLTAMKPSYQDRPNGKRDFEMLHLLLKEAYLKKGHLLYAYCFHNHALSLPSKDNTYSSEYYSLIHFLDWKATEQDIDDVISLLDKPDKSPFETYLTDTHFPSRNALLDLRGTISFRKNNLTAALAAFSQVDEDFWKTKYEFSTYLDTDPFAILSKKTEQGKFPTTKTAFVKRLLDLEQAAKTAPPKAAENFLLAGHAWLECSRLGNSWMMFCYGWSARDQSESADYYTYLPQTKELQEIYFKGTRAMEYLQKAKATGDQSIVAKAEFLMARIQSLSYEWTPAEEEQLDGLPWNQRPQFKKEKEMSFFKKWAEAYQETDAWEAITGACPGIAVYYGE